MKMKRAQQLAMLEALKELHRVVLRQITLATATSEMVAAIEQAEQVLREHGEASAGWVAYKDMEPQDCQVEF